MLALEAVTGNYQPVGIPTTAEAWVGFAFGNEITPQGNLVPGPANEALARLVIRQAVRCPSWQSPRYFLQGEIADAMQDIAARPSAPAGQTTIVNDFLQSDRVQVIRKSSRLIPDGEPTYLDSWEIACQVRDEIAQHNTRNPDGQIRRVGVLAVAHHVPRAAWQTARALGRGTSIIVPDNLPKVFAGENAGQPWTKSARHWAPREIMAILACRLMGGPMPTGEDLKGLPARLIGGGESKQTTPIQ